jgi:hypothetical protein
VQSYVREINQRTLISEGSLVFIEFEEQSIDSLNIRESVVEGMWCWGHGYFGLHDRLSRVHDLMCHIMGAALGARSSFVSCVVSYRSWVLSRYTQTWVPLAIRVG